MLHELLFALNGFTGDVFHHDEGGHISIDKDLLKVPLIHPSEFQILEDILEIASLYRRIVRFISTKEKATTREITTGSGPSGLYVSAVCNGLKEVLAKYLAVLSSLEVEILQNPYMSLTYVRTTLEPFRSLFIVLVSLVMKVDAQLNSSAVIVEIVKAYYDINIQLRESLQPLVPWVNGVLYKQISNWVSFGSIYDPFEEFFIQCEKPNAETSGSSGGTTDDQSGKQQKYIVNFTVVPSHMPTSLTDRILFIGYAIGILRNSEKSKMSVVSTQHQFFQRINDLGTDSFRLEDLDEAIEQLATDVGKDLHHLVVEETDLQKYLGVIKDFYLTGRGELFHDFLLNLQEMPLARNSLLTDISQAFTLAASRVQVQDDTMQRISISLKSLPDVPVKSSIAYIEFLKLGMDVEWPLHILFTSECLDKYNELFVFLLQIRKLQMDLNLLWMNTRKLFRFPIPRGPAELRNVMSYFIDHLQHFLQEDVLECQFEKLKEAVEKSDNFEQIRIAHATFQSNILSQSFQTSKQLRGFVQKIVAVCSNFVKFMNQQLVKQDQVPVNEGVSKEVADFALDFKRHMDLLLNLLQGVAINPQSGQYLSQFLLRLDFNSYFSSTAFVPSI